MQKQIEVLKRKVKSSKQFNEKVELNLKLKKLEELLIRTKNDSN